jgi:hypothetical protein
MRIRLFGAVLGIEDNKETRCRNILRVLGIGKKKVILCPIKPVNTMKTRGFGGKLGIEENKEISCPNI